MPKFKSTVLFVNNIHKAKEFYLNLFPSLELENDFGQNLMFKDSFSLWEISSANRHIFNQTKIETNANALELYFETDNILSFSNRLKKYNLKFIHQLKTEKWGQQTIRFYDLDDNIIEVAEKMDSCIIRIYKELKNIKSVSEITLHSEDYIRKLVEKIN